MAQPSRPLILAVNPLRPEELRQIEAIGEVVQRKEMRAPTAADAQMLAAIDLAVTNGVIGFAEPMFAACPRLRHVHCISAGVEAMDFAAAKRHGVTVSTGKGANADSAADHAMALALGLIRNLIGYDRSVRAGEWNKGAGPPGFAGKNVGIFGLGEIGRRIARRAEGFSARIFYTARAAKPEFPWSFCADIKTLARESDILFVAASGDDSTRYAVDAEVLAALGPKGYLINIARGSIVDTAALVAALKSNGIAGAALDVLETEPDVPLWINGLDNLVVTPHIAGWSPDSRQAMMDITVDNLRQALARPAR